MSRHHHHSHHSSMSSSMSSSLSSSSSHMHRSTTPPLPTNSQTTLQYLQNPSQCMPLMQSIAQNPSKRVAPNPMFLCNCGDKIRRLTDMVQLVTTQHEKFAKEQKADLREVYDRTTNLVSQFRKDMKEMKELIKLQTIRFADVSRSRPDPHFETFEEFETFEKDLETDPVKRMQFAETAFWHGKFGMTHYINNTLAFFSNETVLRLTCKSNRDRNILPLRNTNFYKVLAEVGQHFMMEDVDFQKGMTIGISKRKYRAKIELKVKNKTL